MRQHPSVRKNRVPTPSGGPRSAGHALLRATPNVVPVWAIFLVIAGLLIVNGAFAQPDAYAEGLGDRTAYENWVAMLGAQEKAGADYWASQRSLTTPSPCVTLGGNANTLWLEGCREAQHRLGPSDVRRLSQPEYRLGWNAYAAPPPSSLATPLALAPHTPVLSPFATPPAMSEIVYPIQEGVLAAMGLGGGAIVCPSLSDTRLAFDLLLADWHRRITDQVLANQGGGHMNDDLYGKRQPFKPEAIGCVIVPPGVPLYLDRSKMLYHVKGTLANGLPVEGMTWGSMLMKVVTK